MHNFLNEIFILYFNFLYSVSYHMRMIFQHYPNINIRNNYYFLMHFVRFINYLLDQSLVIEIWGRQGFITDDNRRPSNYDMVLQLKIWRTLFNTHININTTII